MTAPYGEVERLERSLVRVAAVANEALADKDAEIVRLRAALESFRPTVPFCRTWTLYYSARHERALPWLAPNNPISSDHGVPSISY